ncbi:hypothetical protein [Bacteroides uniformis]|nr:hypothetical protein [Bacteroides uniformis]
MATKVIFRKSGKGEIIALFPSLPWSRNDNMVTSYMHMGQHGPADYAGVLTVTTPARQTEFRGLLEELELLGYDDLQVIHRKQQPDTAKRDYENIVSSFMFYMWNRWSERECETVFGEMSHHLWDKWCSYAEDTVFGAAERFYAALSDNNRKKLVDRACLCYDGRRNLPVDECKEK